LGENKPWDESGLGVCRRYVGMAAEDDRAAKQNSLILPKHEVALYEAAFGIPKTVSDNRLSCVNLLVSTPPWSVWTWTSGAIAPAATGMARKSSKCKILQIPALQIPSYSKAWSSDGGIQDRPLKELELQVISTSCFGGIQ
jgi:hypothetical protein